MRVGLQNYDIGQGGRVLPRYCSGMMWRGYQVEDKLGNEAEIVE